MPAVKAAVYYETGRPEVFRYEDVPDPECLPGGVLIEVEAISIEGGDTLNRAGGEMATTPHVVGYQCAGTIREVGDGVDDRFVGQRVVATMLWGSHAELRGARRSSRGRSPTAPTSSRSRASRSRSAPPTTASSSSVTSSGETVLDPGRRRWRRRRGDPAREARRRDRDRDRVERRAARTPRSHSASTTAINYSNDDWVAKCARSPAAAASISSSTRSAARSCRAASRPCVPRPLHHVGSAGRDPQPFDVSVLGDVQPVAHRRVPRRRDRHDARSR